PACPGLLPLSLHDALPIWGALDAAKRALGPISAVIHDEGGARLPAQDLDLVLDSEAAAMLPGTAARLAQGELAEQDREILFHYLDRKSTRLNSSHVKISYA